jgi:hypothetical protein
MAEEPAVQNKGMLVVAVVLGLAAVIVYNLQVSAIRSESRGEQVLIARFTRPMRTGERIDVAKDLTLEKVNAKMAKAVDVITADNAAEMKIYEGRALSQNVNRGMSLSATMVLGSREPLPSDRISDGDFVGIAVPLAMDVGDILRQGDRVNLLARLPTPDGKARVERVIERVRVLGVGGKGLVERPGSPRGEDEGLAAYRKITIELSAEAALEMRKILSYPIGGLDVELLKQTRDSDRSSASPQVKPGVLQMLESGGSPATRPGGARTASPG